jgi:Asp-tRNA(Asn)/Glu-tRNA(Gln) amidotransferase A subunit family amidase
MAPYERKPVSAPTLSGLPLRMLVNTAEGALGATLLKKIADDSGFTSFRKLSAGDASPIQLPLPHPPVPGSPLPPLEGLAAAHLDGPGPLRTAAHLTRAYREGSSDPSQVAARALALMERFDHQADPRMGIFIASQPDEVRAQAHASTERWRRGSPLSPIDGIPVAVKDELDMVPFPTTLGTSFRRTPAERDATLVERLRKMGAVLLGKANMQEIGINPVGINPHHGATRNPYDPSRISGGSSSGSAAAVASGICPMSLGADGGGSIRIPAALCGLVGLKATFGRISEGGIPSLCWNVAHAGPLGASVSDVAALYAAVAGPDPRDPLTLHQPPVHLTGLNDGDLRAITLGICTPHFEDAHPDVVQACREGVKALTAAGARVVEIEPPELEAVLWSHTVIILSEMAESLREPLGQQRAAFGLDSRMNLALGHFFRADDLVHAMRHRTRITRDCLEQMKGVDAIVTPSTATVAPPIPEHALPGVESNLVMVDGLMRFIRLGNLTGFPAISVPCGHDGAGLPVGLQLMGRPWEEHLLLRLAYVVEAATARRPPRVWGDLAPAA